LISQHHHGARGRTQVQTSCRNWRCNRGSLPSTWAPAAPRHPTMSFPPAAAAVVIDRRERSLCAAKCQVRVRFDRLQLTGSCMNTSAPCPRPDRAGRAFAMQTVYRPLMCSHEIAECANLPPVLCQLFVQDIGAHGKHYRTKGIRAAAGRRALANQSDLPAR